jgi:ABC-type uncharacterized transport system permease subunit
LDIQQLSGGIGLFGFALSAVIWLISFQKNKHQDLLEPLGFFLFLHAPGAVTAALAAQSSQAGVTGVSGLLLTGAIGWMAVFGRLVLKMRMVGAFVAPLATLILLIQFFIAPTGHSIPKDSGAENLMFSHIGLSVMGMAFGIIACAVSAIFLWMQNLLKKKLLDQIPKGLPAIDILSTHLTLTLWAGFIFITFGLLTGAIYTQMYQPRSQLNLEFKVIWAIVVWIWYLVILLAKNVFNRPVKKVAQMSLAGFILMAATYFGMGV